MLRVRCRRQECRPCLQISAFWSALGSGSMSSLKAPAHYVFDVCGRYPRRAHYPLGFWVSINKLSTRGFTNRSRLAKSLNISPISCRSATPIVGRQPTAPPDVCAQIRALHLGSGARPFSLVRRTSGENSRGRCSPTDAVPWT